MTRLVISAAEPSGDLLAAGLVRALSDQMPIDAVGIAGPAMRAAGVEPLAQMEDVCAMGLVEVIGRMGAIRRARRALQDAIHQGADALIVVDAPDLHLPLAQAARKQGIVTIGYVSPQVWAWRSGRVRTVRKALDHLMCLFSFEPPLFTGMDARFVGHPLLERVTPRQDVEPHCYGLLPGSRRQEIRRMLPVYLQVAERIRSKQPHATFRLASPLDMEMDLPSWVHRVGGVDELSNVRAALTKSGTITLELAAMGVPQVVAHRVHPITHWLGRRLVRGIRHIAMPNILAGHAVVPEFIQDLDVDRITQALLGLPAHQPVVLDSLGEPGATARAANLVQHWLKEGSA